METSPSSGSECESSVLLLSGRQHHTVTWQPCCSSDFTRLHDNIPLPLKGLKVNSYVINTIRSGASPTMTACYPQRWWFGETNDNASVRLTPLTKRRSLRRTVQYHMYSSTVGYTVQYTHSIQYCNSRAPASVRAAAPSSESLVGSVPGVHDLGRLCRDVGERFSGP